MFALLPFIPLLGAAVNGLFGIRWFSRRAAGVTAVGAAGLSFAAAVAAFAGLLRSAEPVVVKTLFTWVPTSLVRTASGGAAAFHLDLAFRYDSLAAVMTLVVTGVGLLIHIYSLGYMAQDRSYARFFAYLNLFTGAMLVLVLGANLGVMFIGWEGVGLCSYLLIGFWFTKDSAASAGKKAFITNRVGDFGFLLGTGLLVYALGTVDMAAIAAGVEGGALPKGMATAAALLLFLGAAGKSAQIPLYTWLPDAMEGPTPVSALIHAATMVTAGVYMVARLHVLFSFSGTALVVVGLVGAVTAVYAATMGFVQTDIKRVLAYSTISQIGYMFIGLGVGAYAAGIFHLMTHAFFKSLLFLADGSVIHALSGEQDMRRMGGLRTRIPGTFRVFLVGALAISGLPGLSGFFSKDGILTAAFASGHYLVWALGLAGAAMTAFYMFRLIFLTFYGQARFSGETARHLHESPRVMLVPLEILAVLAVAGGYVGLPPLLGGKDWFGRFLETSTGTQEAAVAAGTEVLLMALSVGVALAAIAAAHVIYVKKHGEPARRFAARFRRLYRTVAAKYYVDEIYGRVFVGGVFALGRFADWLDRHIVDGLVDGAAGLARGVSRLAIAFDETAVDGAVNGTGRAHLALSSVLRRLQTGRIYNYALAVVVGVALVITIAVAVF
jgi:NADH-quinone oxidoreductase subunit L